jgi:hypothetical protein
MRPFSPTERQPRALPPPNEVKGEFNQSERLVEMSAILCGALAASGLEPPWRRPEVWCGQVSC